jgi:hydroxyacylglutathione hydrolase
MMAGKIHSKVFVFNPFQENTYVLYRDDKKAVVIDPGMSNHQEEQELSGFLKNQGLELQAVLLTHAHVDHILGLNFIHQEYDVPVVLHEDSIAVLNGVPQHARMYGFSWSPEDYHFQVINEHEQTILGLSVLHVPGHVPGHLVFVSESTDEAWVGDVLFYESIGRTDLPGGDYQLLIQGIKSKVFKLNDTTKVYAGHGPSTSIGHEKVANPFLT